MKKLLNFLKLSASFIFLFVITNTAEAESPLSLVQIPAQTNALITDIMFDNGTVRVAGNFTSVNLNGTDYSTNKYSEITSSTWKIPGTSVPVKDGHFCKVDDVTYLVGNDNAENGKIYKMQSGVWTSIYSISGKINNCSSFGNIIAFGGEFTGYLGFFNTTTNTADIISVSKPVIKIASSTDYTIVTYAIGDQISSIGSIVDNSARTINAVSFPSGMAILRGVGANGQNTLYISGDCSGGNKTYMYANGNWEKIADNDRFFSNFWFDSSTNTLYADNSGTTINGERIHRLASCNMNTLSWSDSDPTENLTGLQGMVFINGNIYINAGLNIFAKISTPTGIKNISSKEKVSIYPNPAANSITLTSPDAREIPLLTLSGEVIKNYKLQKNETLTIDVSDLCSGVYFLDNTSFVKQ